MEQVYHSDTKERATLLTEIKNLQSASERINAEAENLTRIPRPNIGVVHQLRCCSRERLELRLSHILPAGSCGSQSACPMPYRHSEQTTRFGAHPFCLIQQRELGSRRSDDLLLSLLGRTLSKLPHDEAEQMAEEVGAEYGRAMAAGLTGDALKAGQRSLRSAIQAVADALSAHGFAAHAEGRNNQLKIINNHCPFGDVAAEHPVICAVDRGMVRGMLGELYNAADGEFGEITTESSLAAGDTFCTTAV